MRSNLSTLIGTALFLQVGAAAQDTVLFTIDQGASTWSWSGTTSIGPIEGNPSQDFALQGDFGILMTSGAQPIQTAQATGDGAAAVVPDLSGRIPNPIPILPPLAIVDVTNLSLAFSTPPFNVVAGSFTTDITVTALSGTLTVTPLAGAVTMTDLAGTMGDPVAIAGQLTQASTNIHLNSPQMASLTFTDPTTGISGTFNLMGTLVGDFDCPPPTNYCTANMNSAGMTGSISASGSTRIQDNNLNLNTTGLPTNKFGYYLMSRTQGFIPLFGGSEGNLCLGAPQIRFNGFIQNSGMTGEIDFTPDMTNLPQMQVFMPGEEWNFQLWYRDNNPGVTSNTSDGLAVVFCP
ncbi:MAG: hypothetical protein GY711_14100 [bacterium]|nr:hypothetical protein [bacterium]